MEAFGSDLATAAGAAAATRSVMQVLRCGPWFVFFASTLVMASSGGANIFTVYSKDMKVTFGYDQKTLNTLSSFKNLGASLGILPALIISYNLAPPWVLLLAGASMNLVGYLMMYLALSGHTAQPPVWFVCVYIVLGACSQTFSCTAALVTAVNNFPEDRGSVLGLLTGFAGLSGAIIMQLFRVFDATAESGTVLLLLVACLPTAVSLLSSTTIRVVVIPTNDAGVVSGDFKALYSSLLYPSMLLAVDVLAMTIIEREVSGFLKPLYYANVAVLAGLLIIWPLVIVVKQESKTYNQQPGAPTTSSTSSGSSNLFRSADAATSPCASTRTPQGTPMSSPVAGSAANKTYLFSRPPRGAGDNFSLWQAVFSVDMALLVVTTICGIGGMQMAIDNTQQIGQSLGYPQATVSMFASFTSVANFAGRVAAGFGSDFLAKRYRVPRPAVLAGALVLASVGHVLIALDVSNGLYPASLIMDLCTGAQLTLMFATVSEVFGLKHFSTLSNLAVLLGGPGYYVLDVVVTASLYDREAQRRQGIPCIGVKCFRASFFITAGATLVGAAAAMVLAWRTSEFYRARFTAAGAGAVAAATTRSSSSSSSEEEAV